MELIFKGRIGLFDLLQCGDDFRIHRFRRFVGHIPAVNADFSSSGVIVHRYAGMDLGHRHMGLTVFCHRFFGNDLVGQLVQGGYRFHCFFNGILSAVFVVLVACFDGFGRMAAIAVYDDLAGINAPVSDHQVGGVMVLTAGLHADTEIGFDQVILQ